MAYNLNDIIRQVSTDPQGFVAESGERYELNIRRAANRIAGNTSGSRIVLLSGPSGSGKTTTAHKIEARLEQMGIVTHTVSMDDYYRDVGENSPRNERGELDFESPECLDLELLARHFTDLNAGREIVVPRFDFHKQARDRNAGTPLRLSANEMVIFEGIHALNGTLSDAAPDVPTEKVYISARSNIVDDSGAVVFKGTWMRILRRTVRDELFRGADAALTFSMWENLRRGEKRWISPFKNTADVIFDSSFACEVSLLKPFAGHIFDGVKPDFDRYKEIMQLRDALELFPTLDAKFLPKDSMLREFIGDAGL